MENEKKPMMALHHCYTRNILTIIDFPLHSIFHHVYIWVLHTRNIYMPKKPYVVHILLESCVDVSMKWKPRASGLLGKKRYIQYIDFTATSRRTLQHYIRVNTNAIRLSTRRDLVIANYRWIIFRLSGNWAAISFITIELHQIGYFEFHQARLSPSRRVEFDFLSVKNKSIYYQYFFNGQFSIP